MTCPRCGQPLTPDALACPHCRSRLSGVDSVADTSLFRATGEFDVIDSSAIGRATVPVPRRTLPWREQARKMPWTGRDAERSTLTGRVLEALELHRTLPFVVRGALGSGRSRLVEAVRQRVLEQRPETRWLVATGQGLARPFSTIERLLRLRFDIPEYVNGTIAGDRFERAVETFFGDPAGADVARTCGPMLGFRFWSDHVIDFADRSEQARRARTALLNLMTRDLGNTPTVLVVDEAAEADLDSLAFFADLAREAPDLPAVLLLVCDPAGLQRLPWLGELPGVDVPPLDAKSLTAWVRSVLTGVSGVDDRAVKKLVEHAAGRPGAVLDSLDHLQRKGALVETPSGWQLNAGQLAEVIAGTQRSSSRSGRFEGLTDEQLTVASLGAVIGTRFWIGGVVALRRLDRTGPRTVAGLAQEEADVAEVVKACEALTDRGLVVPERAAMLNHEQGFRFVEAADCAALLESHSPEQLRPLARQAAVWLQLVAGERSSDLAEVLAPLWLAAGDPVHASHVYLRAGLLAVDEFRNETAKSLLEQARALAPADSAHLHFESAIALGSLAESDGRFADAETLYRDALQLAWRFRARSREAEALQKLGRLLRNQGKAREALEHLKPALKRHEAVGDLRGLASACDDVGRAYWTGGDMRTARAFLKRAAQYREKLGDRPGQAGTLTSLGVVSLTLGHLDQARAWLDKAVQMQRQARNLPGLFEALNAYGAMLLASAEVDGAIASMEEAHELARRVGNRRMQAMIQNNLGEVLVQADRLDEGETQLYKAVEGAGRLEDHALLADAARNLAIAARKRNDPQRALKWARRSVAAALSSDLLHTRATSQRTLGEVLADLSDVDGADQAFAKAEDVLAQAHEARELQACLQVHAAFLMRCGRTADAEKLVARSDALLAGPEVLPKPTAEA